MSGDLAQTLRNFFAILVWVSLVAGVLAAVMLAWTYRDIRRLRIPANAGFYGTLRIIPLRVAIFLDLLDLALDSFAAPLAWLVLRWLRLDGLRAPAIIEAFIPGTQLLPTMTVLWFATRAFNLGELPASVGDTWRDTTGLPPGQGQVIEGRTVQR